MTVKSLRKQLAAAIAMTLVASVALGSSTYAWFVNNTTVKAESVSVQAKAANNLLIAHGRQTAATGDWGTIATFNSYNSADFIPVSTVGSATYADLAFFKDAGWATDTNGEYHAKEFVAATANTEYFKDTITLKASQASKLYLDTETVFDIAAATGLATSNDTAAALRIALVVDGTGTTSYNGAYIYQVNKDPLSNTYNTTLISMAGDGVLKGIASATEYYTAADEEADPANVEGTVKTAATSDTIAAKNLSSGVTKYLMAGTTNTAPNLATTPLSTAMVETADLNGADVLYQFTAPDDVCVIDVYIWMEGCDYDCNSSVVKNITQQTVTATLGFCVGAAQ